ncbi:MAG TPA: chemotaxis response regulator protein-glutamate methylesterase [Acidisphaera sp.]|nr:chemotaxis response regulator protein-glutamate methylesterase [Acidisphaera sp.]
MNRTIRVLIVDGSPSMRRLVAHALRTDSSIVIVGEAGDVPSARQAIKDLSPDVVTLDVEMPGMNGLDFLEKIMRLRPMPVVMVSTLTSRGAEATIRALELGAVDCVAKPSTDDPNSLDCLPRKVRCAAASSVRSAMSAHPPKAVERVHYVPSDDIVAIGGSTGGVEAALAVLSAFPANGPATLLTLHLPAPFTGSFVGRLGSLCRMRVEQAADGAPIEPGCIYVAPGTVAHLEVAGGSRPRCRLVQGPAINGHRPSVDALFGSIARVRGPRAVGAILTGMGRDGAQGLLAMRQAGAQTFGQDEASCVVFGMPRAANEVGAVGELVPLSRMADRLLTAASAVTAGAQT